MAHSNLPVSSLTYSQAFPQGFRSFVGEIDRILLAHPVQPNFTDCAYESEPEQLSCFELATVSQLETHQEFCLRHHLKTLREFSGVRRG